VHDEATLQVVVTKLHPICMYDTNNKANLSEATWNEPTSDTQIERN